MTKKRNLNISLPEEYIKNIVAMGVEEDAENGDVTSESLIPADLQGVARMLIKADGVLAGIEVVKAVYFYIDTSIKVDIKKFDGTFLKKGDVVMEITGNMRGILKGERVALNFIQRMSGIASTTALYVERVKGTGVDIADTRKTTPGLRLLEKYAVSMGGGRNHRMNLSDAVLIKDNHFDSLRTMGMGYKDIVLKAEKEAPHGIQIEAEARNIQQAIEAVEAGVDIVMLDNMSLEDMKQAVKLIDHRAEVEASGGITLENVRSVAETGVDFISVGALTHSYNSLDISLEIELQTLNLI